MSDTLQLLGKLATKDAGRDAVHIAVVPLIAAHILNPGERIGWIDDDREKVGRVPTTFGIVDPYLPEPVMPGQRFYGFLYPQTITSLRHVWQHPSFADEGVSPPRKAEAEAELRAMCRTWDGPNYDVTMAALLGKQPRQDSDGDYDTYAVISDGSFFVHGSDACGAVPDRFWTLAEIITGRPIADRAEYFSCSC